MYTRVRSSCGRRDVFHLTCLHCLCRFGQEIPGDGVFPPTVDIDHHISCNPKQPGAKWQTALPITWETIEHFHKDLLRQIGRVLVALCPSAEIVVEAVGIPHTELPEGGRLGSCGPNQRGLITFRLSPPSGCTI